MCIMHAYGTFGLRGERAGMSKKQQIFRKRRLRRQGETLFTTSQMQTIYTPRMAWAVAGLVYGEEHISSSLALWRVYTALQQGLRVRKLNSVISKSCRVK